MTTPSPQPVVQVDAFTDVPFSGNPAAICVLSSPREERWMQDVAREMNLSETAFLLREGDGFSLRWFTPAVEVDLCGHATLASAHVIWEDGHVDTGAPISFFTKSGVLTARRSGAWIELDFPADDVVQTPADADLVRGIGVPLVTSCRGRFDELVELASEQAVRELSPDLAALRSLKTRGVIVTARADDCRPYDFVSRFFAPGAGIDEDPVTGSAHCALATFWGPRLGKDEMVGYQASARGGVVKVHRQGARVILGGQAVTVMRGTLLA